MANDVALATLKVSRSFGALRALDGVSLSIPAGQRRAIIGPNGAGKTTLFNVISGEISPTSGSVTVNGNDVTRLPREARVHRGLGRTFQRTNLFPALTPFECVRLAVQRRLGFSHSIYRRRKLQTTAKGQAERALASMGLEEVAYVPIRQLSYGFQRQTEVAVALGTSPRVLLLDEPTAGLSLAETDSLIEVMASLPGDLTMVIIEHDMDVVFALAEWITVMHQGRVFADGPPAEIQDNSAVQEIYFG